MVTEPEALATDLVSRKAIMEAVGNAVADAFENKTTIAGGVIDAINGVAALSTPAARMLAGEAAKRCYTVEGNYEAREKALAKWVREAMRFIDLCDADAGGYDDLHGDAERLTVDGYSLFGAMVEFDKWCLADLEHRTLTAFLDRHPPAAEPVGLREAVEHLLNVGEFCRTDDTESALRKVRQALATPARTDDAGAIQ